MSAPFIHYARRHTHIHTYSRARTHNPHIYIRDFWKWLIFCHLATFGAKTHMCEYVLTFLMLCQARKSELFTDHNEFHLAADYFIFVFELRILLSFSLCFSRYVLLMSWSKAWKTLHQNTMIKCIHQKHKWFTPSIIEYINELVNNLITYIHDVFISVSKK